MTGPSLKTTAAVSLAIHIVFFTTTIIIMNNSNHYIRPMPYTVRLVGADAGNLSSTTGTTGAGIQTQQSPDQALSENNKTVADEAKEYAEYRIAALKAKKKAAEAVKLRTTIISLKGSKSSDKEVSQSTDAGGGISGGGNITGIDGLLDKYGDKINAEIRQHWSFPEIKGKNFEAVLEVTIMKDGTIIVHGIEKSSGDALFDSSVIKAIKKTSRVTQPPYEMKKIGLIFRP